MFRATMCPSSGADDCVMLEPPVRNTCGQKSSALQRKRIYFSLALPLSPSLLGKYMDETIGEIHGVFNGDNPILFTFHK